MSHEIIVFLEKLKKWPANFEVKKFNIKGQGELDKIVELQMNKKIGELIKVWEIKLTKEYFELPHPEYPEIMSRAVLNIQKGMANFVFMIDEENKFPWFFGQCEGFIDYIVTSYSQYKTSKSNHTPVVNHINNISDLDSVDLAYKDIKFGFLLSQNKPYHFFYDHLKYLVYFNKKSNFSLGGKIINDKKSFFNINKKNDIHEDLVLLYPALIGNNHINQSQNKSIRTLNQEMEDFVYKDALLDCTSVGSGNDSLKIWYGITGQKRSWLEQIEGIDQIVKNLLPYFSEIEVYIDGITAPEGKRIRNAEDEDVYNKIFNLIDGKCQVYSLVGEGYRKKIQVCSRVDVFIANAGGGCIVPLRFCKKPGVLHSNSFTFVFPDIYPESVKIFDKDYVKDVPNKKNPRHDFCSYHIPWQHIFNLTAEVLNLTKGVDVKMLKVQPLVE